MPCRIFFVLRPPRYAPVYVARHIDRLLTSIDEQVGYGVRACLSMADVLQFIVDVQGRCGNQRTRQITLYRLLKTSSNRRPSRPPTVHDSRA